MFYINLYEKSIPEPTSTQQIKTHRKFGCLVHEVDSLQPNVKRTTERPTKFSKKDTSVTWSYTHITFSFNTLPFSDHPPSLSWMNRTIHHSRPHNLDRVESRFVGWPRHHDGNRSRSLICFVIIIGVIKLN